MIIFRSIISGICYYFSDMGNDTTVSLEEIKNHRIEIDSLIPNNTGHFTSNYVCVISIDDGRYFVDYHYTDNPMNYGVGRLFSHSWINGVNYSNGFYVKEGRKRLSLVALYDCGSKEEAVKTFNTVFRIYKEKYGDLVISNKEEKEKKTKREVVYYENSPTIYLFPYYENPIPFESLDDFKKLYSSLPPKGYRVKMHLNNTRHLPNANYIRGVVNADGSSNICFVFKSVERIKTIDFKSNGGFFSIDNENTYRPNKAEFFISPPGQYDDSVPERPPIKTLYVQLLKALIGESLVITCNGNTAVSIEETVIKKFIVFLTVSLFLLTKAQNAFINTANTWYKQEDYMTINERDAKLMASISPVSVDVEKLTAKFKDTHRRRYFTTPSSCSCLDFQKYDYDKLQFVPCKHMRWLVQKAGMLDHQVLPECYDPIVEMMLSQCDDNHSGYKNHFVTETVEGWQRPLITIKNGVQITDIKSSETFNLSLWLNRHNIIVNITAPFYDGYGGSLFVEEKYIGTIFLDNGGTGYYKIDNAATVHIYRKILSGKSFTVRLQMKYGDKKPYDIQFPETVGFADYYCMKYDDAIVKYEIKLKEKRGLKKKSLFSKHYRLKRSSIWIW